MWIDIRFLAGIGPISNTNIRLRQAYRYGNAQANGMFNVPDAFTQGQINPDRLFISFNAKTSFTSTHPWHWESASQEPTSVVHAEPNKCI